MIRLPSSPPMQILENWGPQGPRLLFVFDFLFDFSTCPQLFPNCSPIVPRLILGGFQALECQIDNVRSRLELTLDGVLVGPECIH